MTSTKCTYMTVLAALVCVCSGTGHALPITVITESSGASGTISDSATSNTPGTVTATVLDPNGTLPDFSGFATSLAIQSSDGNALVSVSGLFSNGTTGRALTALALFEESVTNNTALAQAVTFNFVIAPTSLELIRFSRYGVTFASTASYDIAIEQDGIGIFASGAQLVGINNLVQLFDDADTDPSATTLNGVVSGPITGSGTTVANFGAYSGSIDLGILAPGLSTTIFYSMLASFTGPEFESGGTVSIGDPLNFGITPGIEVSFEFSDAPSGDEVVEIDVKPGSDPNAVNPRSKGVIPVAVLGSVDFDATQVDFSTVAFGPGGASPIHGGHVEDVNGDGFFDTVLHFKTQETGIQCGDIEATLTGETFGGEAITDSDTIKTVSCR